MGVTSGWFLKSKVVKRGACTAMVSNVFRFPLMTVTILNAGMLSSITSEVNGVSLTYRFRRFGKCKFTVENDDIFELYIYKLWMSLGSSCK